jgi:hypothetical protein
MSHYFTREEAEALLPAISVVLRAIQESRAGIRALEEELEVAHKGSMSNGHYLHESSMRLQRELATLLQTLRTQLSELQQFGCELKDTSKGLIDFLSLRDGQEVYLCWQLGEDRIRFWHYLNTGFAGRQPL